MWTSKLLALGWSERAATQLPLYQAKSTRGLYNRQISRLADFCSIRQIQFPPSDKDIPVLAEFLCEISDSSLRPESILRTVAAALSSMYEAHGLRNLLQDNNLKRLLTALVKSGTMVPGSRTKVMPIKPFHDMFQSWGPNDTLTTKQLRLRAVTLLAFSLMARPSDLAPRGEHFDTQTFDIRNIVLSQDNIVFNADGSLTITLFGIKNDRSRSGFEVRIPGTTDHRVDPVACLHSYINRTDSVRQGLPDHPVFISLRPHNGHYQAVTAATISQILNEAIKMANLDGQGYTARSFRPTGATAAVQCNTKPETAMQIGRWKTDSVFRERYVYPLAQDSYTTDILQFAGVDY